MLLLAPHNTNLATSIGVIFIIAAFCRIVRILSSSLIKSNYKRSIFLETVAALELTSSCFEFGVVMESQGFLVYVLIMLVIFNYWGTAWQSAVGAPHVLILEAIFKRTDWRTAFIKILAQISGACMSYPLFIKPLWSFGYQTTHIQRLLHAECHTHLQVSVLEGFAVEAIATFVFFTAIATLGPKKYSFLSLPLALVSIVYAGISITGCYFNPLLASTIQFGCKGITLGDHFLVYWMGPIIGGLAHSFACKLINSKTGHLKKNK